MEAMFARPEPWNVTRGFASSSARPATLSCDEPEWITEPDTHYLSCAYDNAESCLCMRFLREVNRCMRSLRRTLHLTLAYMPYTCCYCGITEVAASAGVIEVGLTALC